jgi:hypothetical protein
MAPCRREPLPICVEVGDLVADAASLDLLSRLALVARRCGYRLALRNPSPALTELIEFAGLTETLPSEPVRPRLTEPRC